VLERSQIAGSTIGRLHVRIPANAASEAGPRCTTAIRVLDLQPPGMAPDAVLCVRSLPDPLPGAIDLRGADQRPPLAWESAARTALARLLQRAARPARELVVSDVDAVFFADRAELMACMARDASLGALGRCWWWRHLLHDVSFPALMRVWQENPTWVPAALGTLAVMGNPPFFWFLRNLERGHARYLLDAVCSACAASSLSRAIAHVLDDVPLTRNDSVEELASRRTMIDAGRGSKSPGFESSAVSPPWRALIGVDLHAAELRVEPAVFAAITLMLQRAPAVARSTPFIRATVAYLRQTGASTRSRGVRTIETVARARNADGSPPVEAPRASGLEASRPAASLGIAAGDGWRATGADRARIAGRKGDDPQTAHAPDAACTDGRAAHRRPSSIGPGPASPSPIATTKTGFGVGVAGQPGAAIETGMPARDVWIESAFAGAFFLLNVFEDLDLFSTWPEEDSDAAPSIWEIVRQFTLALIGRDFELDPLCAFLERLAPVTVEPWSDTGATPLPLAVFERIRGHIRALIDADDAPALLVRQRGRVVTREGCLEVEFSLDGHPIHIRAARLDRNPGWVALAATHISFVFSSSRVGVVPDTAQPSRRR
jgi:hypothetical protein